MKNIILLSFIFLSFVSLGQVQYGSSLLIPGAASQTTLNNNILLATAGAGSTNSLGFQSGSVEIVSTGTGGAYIFEQSNDNTNWTVLVVHQSPLASPTILVGAVTPTAATIMYKFAIDGAYIRCRISTAITGGSLTASTKLNQYPFAASTLSVNSATGSNLNMVLASGTLTSIGTSVTPGTAAANLAKAEDAVSASGDTEIPIMGIRRDAPLISASTNGDYNEISISSTGELHVMQHEKYAKSYSSGGSFTPASGPTDFFTISGNATNTVYVTKIIISTTATTAGGNSMQIFKRTTANTGGTVVGLAAVAFDANDASSTTVINTYTVNPTGLGTGAVMEMVYQPLSSTTTLYPPTILSFGERGKPVILRGTAQSLALNFAGGTIAGLAVVVSVEYYEE